MVKFGGRWGRGSYLMHILSLSVDDGIITSLSLSPYLCGCCHVILHLNCCCHCNKIRKSRSISTHLLSLSCIRRKTNTKKKKNQQKCKQDKYCALKMQFLFSNNCCRRSLHSFLAINFAQIHQVYILLTDGEMKNRF